MEFLRNVPRPVAETIVNYLIETNTLEAKTPGEYHALVETAQSSLGIVEFSEHYGRRTIVAPNRVINAIPLEQVGNMRSPDDLYKTVIKAGVTKIPVEKVDITSPGQNDISLVIARLPEEMLHQAMGSVVQIEPAYKPEVNLFYDN